MSMRDLKNGPWTTIFEGSWDKHRIEFFQNPDNWTLTLIHDENGQVAILNKYFVFEGNHEKVSEELDCYCSVIEKNYPSFKGKYFAISTGPKYFSDEELDHEIGAESEKLQKITEEFNTVSKKYKSKITELKNARDEFAERLFSEPSTLTAITSREYRQEISKSKEGEFVLGKEISGEDAVEKLDAFNVAVVEGTQEQQVYAMKVIAENCVSNNMNVIVFDEEGYFEKMAFPNRDLHAFEGYSNLQPVGMPVKTPALETIPIDLNAMDKDMFRELIGASGEKNYEGHKAVKIIGNVLEKYKGKIDSLEELEDLVYKEKDDENKFHAYRGARIIKVIGMAVGAYIGGRTNIRDLTSGRLNRMGIVTRIDISDLPENIKKLFVLSIFKTLIKHTGKNTEHIIILPDSEKYIPKNPKTIIEEELFHSMEDTVDKGVGFCVGAENESLLNKEITGNKSLMIDFIKENEVAIKNPKKRNYRAKLRPALSG